MSDFKKELDTDTGGVESHRFLEIPISGPGSANRLITITGIAVPDADISDGRKPASELNYGDIFIKTDYRLKDTDKWLGIVDGNTTLQAATYASLASITFDDALDADTVAVDSVDTTVDTDGRIRVHVLVALQGDMTIHRISYHANILVQKG